MKVIDFYALPRSGQDRILDSCRGTYDPRPIAVAPGVRPKAELWGALSVGSAVALVALWAIGYGDLDSSLARHPIPMVVVFAGLAFAVGLGIVQALAYRAKVAGMSMVPGVYLFAGNVIDAREPELRVYPIEEATSVAVRGSSELVVVFPEARFSFAVEEGRADHAVQTLEQARTLLAPGPSDDVRRDLDALVPLAVAAPLAPTVPIEPPAVGWLRFRWAVPALAAVVGVGLFFARDRASDGALFAAALKKNDVAAFRSYLAKGDAHREEVQKTLLPRAELKIAAEKGTVEAIDELKQKYPETAIDQEIEHQRKVAIVRAFEKARNDKSLQAMLRFESTYPKHHLANDVAKAKHVLYQAALTKFQKALPERSGDAGAIAAALIAHAEKVGPKRKGDVLVGPPVAVRIHRVPSESMDRADDVVRRNPYYNGESSLPTRYLDAKGLEPHEKAAAAAFSKALAKGFSSEIITFEPGETVTTEERPEVKVPTVFVSYRLEPSGNAFASTRPRGIFMGLVFFFDVWVVVPGTEEPFHVKHTLDVKVPVKTLLDMGKPYPRGGKIERQIYDEMLEQGFAELEKRYFRQWYR
ncbi:MAG TPA: hypothetical protein ENK57_20290 [Polyangiaceae bacterium]|nr:hypothetical protein [Polyangiaceae bacterium]